MSNLFDYSKIHLLEKTPKSIFIKDPIYGSINFSEKNHWLYQLINTYEFQRLSRIRQLSFTFLNFPSAVHTRYSHSLGVYELCNRFIRHFLDNNYLSESKDQAQINIALATALLHDIGHGPLSHAFESVSENFSHETMGINIISSKETKINQILVSKALEDNLPKDFYWQEIVKALNRTSKYKWIIDLISSNLDVDRFDFLLRDSYYSGVSYGNTVDVNILIKWSVIHQGRFLFLTKAKNHLEHFFLARHHMYTDLYCNKISDCYEKILFDAFEYIKNNQDKLKVSPSFLKLSFLFGPSETWNISDFLKLYDDYFLDLMDDILSYGDQEALRLRGYLFGKGNRISCKNLPTAYISSVNFDFVRKKTKVCLLDPESNTLLKVNI